MAAKYPTFCLILCTILCVAMLLSSSVVAQAPVVPAAPVVPGLIPFPAEGPSSQHVQQCWSSLADVPGCVIQIYGAFSSGQFKVIDPACCKAITEVKGDCWEGIFPSNPFFPSLLNSSCAQSGGGTANHTVPNPKDTLPSSMSFGKDLSFCLSSINKVPGCLGAITRSIITLNINNVSPACCKAILQIIDNCWYRLFPFNPFFPPLIYKFCGGQGEKVMVPSLPLVKPSLTFHGPGLLPPAPAKCWSSLASTQGCLSEIYGALSIGQFGSIGPACCKAISDINNNCWPQMFPMNPLFPPFLKGFCAGGAALPPPSPPYK